MAAQWSNTRRMFCWPTPALIAQTVSRGCDLVPVSHPDCKNNIWQWRLSFSRAEVVLLQSWTPLQQIVYHMLRFFAKRLLIATDGQTPVTEKLLCGYHIKTLMLWSCEERPPEFWNKGRLVRICATLLGVLATWLRRRECSNYFLPQCDLLGHAKDELQLAQLQRVVNKMQNFDLLCKWFLENYVFKCFYDDNRAADVATLGDNPTFDRLRNSILTYTSWRTQLFNSTNVCYMELCVRYVRGSVHKNFIMDLERFSVYVNGCDSVDSRIFNYFSAVIRLYVASLLQKAVISDQKKDNMFDVLALILCSYPPKTFDLLSQNSRFRRGCSAHFFEKVVEILRLSRRKLLSPDDVRLLVEVAKRFLHRSLKLEDRYSDSIYSAAHVYLALIHYTTGNYQMTVDHCRSVTPRRRHSNVQKYTLLLELFLKIDDFTRIRGFIHLYRYIISVPISVTSSIHRYRINEYLSDCDGVTPKTIAYYFKMRCFLVICQDALLTKKLANLLLR